MTTLKALVTLSCLLAATIVTGACREGSGMRKQDGIHWEKGGMRKALETAKASSKPLFVYWGAVWCPPCNVIKSTVFPDPAVIRASSKFVSVYLDGDTEEAQSWGERLNASGYPTLMVLNAAGEEVSRLSTSITAAEFAETLERLASELVPIDRLVERALDDGAKVPREHWKLITGYSWAQRSHLEKDPLASPDVFARMAAKVPAELPVEKSRMHFLFLEKKLEADGAAGRKSWDKAFREEQSAWLGSILADRELVRANLQSLAHGAADFATWLFPDGGEPPSAFISDYLAAMERAREGGGLSAYERLITDYPAVRFAELKKGFILGEEARKAIRGRVMAAIGAASDEKEHSFALNSGAYILRGAGFAREAMETLKAHVSKAKAPYYVMASIAELEQEDGNLPAALEWHQKAYLASLGSATRVQWGTNYVSTFLKARPEAKAEIVSELEKFYGEHLRAADAFMGRNKSRMTRLSREAGEWASKHSASAELEGLARKLRGLCDSDSAPASQTYRAGCRAYFESFGKPAKG